MYALINDVGELLSGRFRWAGEFDERYRADQPDLSRDALG
jgi:hypothetical protein